MLWLYFSLSGNRTGQEAESVASCSFLAHSTQHLVSPSKLELMGKVHSSIIVLHVWDIEGSPPFFQLPNWQEIKRRSEQKATKPPKTSSLLSSLKSSDRAVNNGSGDLDLQIFTFPWLG